MDFDELETKEEEVGPDDEILSRARMDPSWQEWIQRREEQLRAEEEEEAARLQKLQEKAQQDSMESTRGDEIMARYRAWELRRVEERRQRLRESNNPNLVYEMAEDVNVSCWDEFVKDNSDLFPRVDTNAKEGAYHMGYVEEMQAAEKDQEEREEVEEQEDPCSRSLTEESLPEARHPVLEGAVPGRPRQGRRRRGAFSSAVAAEIASEAEGGGGAEEERPQQAALAADDEAAPDPTGLSPEDPTFDFVRKAIDVNREKNKAQRKVEELREQWKADVEAGIMVPYLAEVLERIEEDEQRDPERQVDILPIENVLAKIEQEQTEDAELEKVRDFLPDLEKKRQETTLAIWAPQQEVPLANPAIQTLQEMYPEHDYAPRDALESFEVAQSSHQPTEEGYLAAVAAKRAEAAAEEREWMAWKAKEDMKRRLRKEGLAFMLPPAPKNTKVGNLPPSHQQKAGGGGSSSSSAGLGRGIGGPHFAPLARSLHGEPPPRSVAAPPQPPPPQEESEEDKAAKEEWERQERARLSKERLERMKERRRQREAEEAR